MIHKRSTALERSVKTILLEGLHQFHDTNLALSSDVDHDTGRKTPNLSMHNLKGYK